MYKENALSNISSTVSAFKVTINSHNYTFEELYTLPSWENFIFPNKNSPLLCPKTTVLTIGVQESRVNSSNWKLYASINHDLTSSSGIVLKDSLVTIDKDENITVLSNTPTFVYNGENNGGSIKVTNITWKKQEDILLQITDALSIKL